MAYISFLVKSFSEMLIDKSLYSTEFYAYMQTFRLVDDQFVFILFFVNALMHFYLVQTFIIWCLFNSIVHYVIPLFKPPRLTTISFCQLVRSFCFQVFSFRTIIINLNIQLSFFIQISTKDNKTNFIFLVFVNIIIQYNHEIIWHKAYFLKIIYA